MSSSTPLTDAWTKVSVLTLVWLIAGYHIILFLAVFEHIPDQQAYDAQGFLITVLAPTIAVTLGTLLLPLLLIDTLWGLRPQKTQTKPEPEETPDPVALAFGRPQR